MLHAVLVDGMIEKIEGSPQFADAEVARRRDDGHSSAYLLAARSDNEFERKRKVRPLVPRRIGLILRSSGVGVCTRFWRRAVDGGPVATSSQVVDFVVRD